MKEATSELNGMVFVAISVGILATFFFTVLWPMLNNNFNKNAECGSAICGYACSGTGLGEKVSAKNGTITCCYIGNNSATELTCPYKG